MWYRAAIFALIFSGACTTPAIIATRSIQQGDEMNNTNRYDEAIHHYEDYLKISPQLGLYRNPSQEADVCRKLAHVYATQGKYKQSFGYLSRALGIDSTLAANNLEVIDDYRELGVVKAYMGDYRQAIDYLNTSLRLSDGMESSAKNIKKTTLADTYLSLAQVNLTLGNFREATDYGRKALRIYSGISGEKTGLIECNLLLGIVQRDRGNIDEAIRLIRTSESISRKEGLSTARHHQALGEVYFLRGEPEEGIREIMLAIEEAEKSHIKPQMVMMYMRMGDAYQRLGNSAQAEFFYQKAMSIKMDMDADTLGFIPSGNMRFADAQRAYDYYASSGATLGTALVGLRLSELRLQQNDIDGASLMIDSALAAFRKAGSTEGIAKAIMERAKILTLKEAYDPALDNLSEAQALTIQPDLLWQIEMRRGTIHERKGAFRAAYDSYGKAIDIIESMRGNISVEEFKTLFANTKVEAYDRLIMLLMSHNIPGIDRQQAIREAFAHNELSRSRTFLDMLGNKKIDAKEISDTTLLEREQLLRLKIQQLTREQTATSRGGDRIIADELERAQQEYDHVLSTIKLNNPAYATVTNVEPPSIEDIQARLDRGTAIVEYWLSDSQTVIWVLEKDHVTARTVDAGREALKRLVIGSRNAIAYKEREMMQRSIDELYRILVAPVRDQLTSSANIVIVPHRSLHFLPFQALRSEDKTFLAEQFVITYSPASSILYYCLDRQSRDNTSFLGMALADLDVKDYPSLPATRREIELLSQLYPGSQSRYGEACDEAYVKENASRFNFLHIATHGVFNEHEPVYSYLLMAPSEKDDGRLTVNEIFSLDISSRLVTLSACETALGDLSEGDELVGLSRAFIYAGSSAVLVSLWKVEDNTTALLMTRFHQYLSSGKTAAESLTLAQRDLIQKRKALNHEASLKTIVSTIDIETIDQPYFWAPFILIGNGQAR